MSEQIYAGPAYRHDGKLKGVAPVIVPDASDPYWAEQLNSFASYRGHTDGRLLAWTEADEARLGQDCETGLPSIDYSDREVTGLPASITFRLNEPVKDNEYLVDFDDVNIPREADEETCVVSYWPNPLSGNKQFTLAHEYLELSTIQRQFYYGEISNAGADITASVNYWMDRGLWQVIAGWSNADGIAFNSIFWRAVTMPRIILSPLIPSPIGGYRGSLILGAVPGAALYPGRWNIMYAQGGTVS